MVYYELALFVFASFLLIKSASYAVKSISKIAVHMRFSEFFVSFIIAGFVSILPEFFIGVNSALGNTPEIGIGAIIGSNIADLTLVLGLTAIAGKKIFIDKAILKNNFWFIFMTSMPVLFMLDGSLTKNDGIVLIFMFFAYVYFSLKKEKAFRRSKIKRNDAIINISIFLLSMAGLFVSSYFIVDSAAKIASEFMVPYIFVGLFLVAIGTTLPELTLSIQAILAKHKEIAFGDILGNVAIDSTFSIGVVALIHPIETHLSASATSIFFMIFFALVAVVMFQTEKKISWKEGIVLIVLYGIFAVVELNILL